MKYSILRIQGKQYKVSEGDQILVDKLTDQKMTPEVLLMVEDDKVQIGKPTIKAKVTYKIVGDEKGEKIDVFKFKAKSRYRKHKGFRSQLTRLQIEKIA